MHALRAALLCRPELRQFAILIFHVIFLTLMEVALIGRGYAVQPLAKYIARHFLMIAAMDAVILAVFAVAAVIERRIRGRDSVARQIAVLLFGLQTVAILLLDVIDHYTFAFMGRLLDGGLIWLILSEGFSRAEAWGAARSVVLATAIAAIILFAAIGLGRLICHGLPALRDVVFRRRGRVLGGVLAMMYILGFAGVIRVAVGQEPRGDDPLIALTVTSIANTSGSDTRNLAERPAYGSLAGSAANGRNLVIIVSDSLRADHLPLYGYERMTAPFLTRLAAGGELHKVETVTSACSESVCGIFSILGSKLLSHAGGSANFMLHQALKDRGYRIHFILSGAHLHWPTLPALYGPVSEFSTYVDGDTSGRRTDDRSVLDSLASLPNSNGEANFFFIFLMSSHVSGLQFVEHPPFQPLPETFDPQSLFLNEGHANLGEDDRQRNINRYDNGVAQADAVIEQIFGILQSKGYLSSAVTLITADHGDALGERGLYGHTRYLYPEFVRIPLFIYDPTGRRYGRMDFADQTDVAVTALDLLGLPKPASWEGRSLVADGQRSVAFTQNDHLSERPCRGVYLRHDETLNYLLRCEDSDGKFHEEAFDLTADPRGLSSNAPRIAPSVLDEMRRRLLETFPIWLNQF